VLVHWRDEQASLAMWEDLDDFRSRFPDFQLEDELASRGGEMSCAAAPTPGAGAHAMSAGRKSARLPLVVRRASWLVR
jgi:hypothetical protein